MGLQGISIGAKVTGVQYSAGVTVNLRPGVPQPVHDLYSKEVANFSAHGSSELDRQASTGSFHHRGFTIALTH